MPFTLDDYGAYSSPKQYICQFPSATAIQAEGRGPQKAGGFIVLGPIFFPYCSPKPTEMFGWGCASNFFFFFFLQPEVIGEGIKK